MGEAVAGAADADGVRPNAPGGELWRGAMDWLADVGVSEPAAVAMASVLEELAGPAHVVVRGPAGIGAALVADAIRGHRDATAWEVRAEEGEVFRDGGDVVVRLTHDPDGGAVGAEAPEVIAHPRGRGGAGITVARVGSGGVGASGVGELVAAVQGRLMLAEVRGRREARLRRAIAEIAAAHPITRDELEELLWP